MIIDDFSNPKRKLTVSEASAANDYFTRRKSEEDRIAGVKAPAKNKKNPANTDYSKKRKQQDVEESGRPFRGTGGRFNRGDDERHDLDPTDWYIVKDGKLFAASIYPRQVQQAIAQGFCRTKAEARARASSQGVAEGEGKTQKYEMMMRNGQVKKFIAKDDADAKRIAAGHGAKSVIKLRGGVPAGKVAEQGVAEGATSTPAIYVKGLSLIHI